MAMAGKKLWKSSGLRGINTVCNNKSRQGEPLRLFVIAFQP
jgi:hypothetical protein